MKIKKKIKVLSIIFLIGFFTILIFEAYIWLIPVNNTKKADAAIVLGCSIHGRIPTPFLKARTLKAAEIYKDGRVKYIIVSGGKGPGEDISEAECMKKILVDNGVEQNKILLENRSSNTSENIAFSNKLMNKYNFKNAIVVSNLFHLRRAEILCRKNKLSATYSGVFVKKYWQREIYGGLREVPAIIKDVVLN
ncbi:YdcF family protein [Clostridium oryzae]|uniref:Vancomycin high temperature exclusion protein n=1 Tax=Clostridium oryzae TaxID=1450648 RepID=A0A1V4IJ13_9CLOT|nr:YdcF family protein [Clostridium oryzae]OPJ59695.1 vancomycin high temperature exclusion protein [Clostridium oryzae]